jgi:hypothetical protein
VPCGQGRIDFPIRFARYGTPEIVNTDQGSQFTAEEFTSVVLAHGCKLSMDGRGAWRDNVFVERLWRSVKYERVYLKAYDGVSAARADIAEYLDWYNAHRSHSSLEQPSRVEPVHPREPREFDGLDGPPGAEPLNHLRLNRYLRRVVLEYGVDLPHRRSIHRKLSMILSAFFRACVPASFPFCRMSSPRWIQGVWSMPRSRSYTLYVIRLYQIQIIMVTSHRQRAVLGRWG